LVSSLLREDREIYRWYHYLCLFFLVALAGLDFPEKKPTMEEKRGEEKRAALALCGSVVGVVMCVA